MSVCLRLRRALALLIYTVSLLLDYFRVALGRLAAWITGDVWPEQAFVGPRESAGARSGRRLPGSHTGRPHLSPLPVLAVAFMR